MSLLFHALDVRAELAQFFVEMFVAAIDVIDAADLGHAIGLQARQDERGGGAQIARHDRRADQSIDALDHRGRAFDLHVRAHALQFRDMHVALRENVFRDDADSLGRREQRAHLRLHVGRKTGIRLGREFERFREAPFGETEIEFCRRLDAEAGFRERVRDGGDMFGLDAVQRDALARRSRRRPETCRLRCGPE